MLNLQLSKLFLFFFFLTSSSSAFDLTFNGFFNRPDLLLQGSAKVDINGTLSLTQPSPFSSGRALYHSKIITKWQETSTIPVPFRTNFTFSINPYKNQTFPDQGNDHGHALAFILVPSLEPESHAFGVEFDVHNNHVAINMNSLTSLAAHRAGYWVDDRSFKEVKLNNGVTYRAWIEYTWRSHLVVSVTIAPSELQKKPEKPLIEAPKPDLGSVLHHEMFVGFSATTGNSAEDHRIMDWSFHNTIIY